MSLKKSIIFLALLSLIFSVSCCKTETEDVKSNSINNPNLKTEFVSVEASDWQMFNESFYQLEYESSIMNSYKAVDSVAVLVQLPGVDMSLNGSWCQLPCNNYSYEIIDNKIFIYSNSVKGVHSNIFKLEIKVSEYSAKNKSSTIENQSMDDLVKLYNNVQKTNTVLLKFWEYYNSGSTCLH